MIVELVLAFQLSTGPLVNVPVPKHFVAEDPFVAFSQCNSESPEWARRWQKAHDGWRFVGARCHEWKGEVP